MAQENKTDMYIHIPVLTILKILGVLIAIYFLYSIKDVVMVIFVATLLAMAFSPMVDWLSKKRIPRPLGIIIIYLILFIIFFGVIALIIPPLIEEVAQITQHFPALWEKFMQSFSSDGTNPQESEIIYAINQGLSSMKDALASSTSNVFSMIRTVFGNIISFILILVLAFYFLVQEGAIRRAIKYLTPPEYHANVYSIISKMQDRIGRWLRGEMILVLVVGILILIGLKILNVKYFLVLALLAGIMEVIPYVGPFISAVPAVFIAFSDSIWKGLAVIVLYWIVQQMENHIIVPKVMQKAIGLNPIIIILAILIGAKLFGFLGVVIAVPTIAAGSVLVKFFYQLKVLGRKPEEILKEE